MFSERIESDRDELKKKIFFDNRKSVYIHNLISFHHSSSFDKFLVCITF